MMQLYLRIHSWHLVSPNMSPPAHMLRATYLIIILTEEASIIKLTSCQVGPFLSDHKLVSAMLNAKKPPIEKKLLSVHKLHCITEENFESAFNENAIDLTSPVDTVLHQFNNKLHKALGTIAPLKEMQVAVCKRQPWFDMTAKARHKVVQNREQIWHKYPKPDTWKAYQVERNVCSRHLNYKKKQFISKQVIDSKGNNKKLYN